MLFLSLKERAELAKFVVSKTAGRLPVVASGHISDDPHSQTEELLAAANSGADGVVLVSNHLDPKNGGTESTPTSIRTSISGCMSQAESTPNSPGSSRPS